MQLKSTSLLLIFIVFSFNLLAQVPEQFSFQGVARNAEGKVIANTAVSVRLTIHTETSAGTVVYQETHKPITSPQGVFTLSVGRGTVLSGQFDQILWSLFPHFLQLEMDQAGGSTYLDLGTTQLQSVPYALSSMESTRWRHGLPVIQELVLEPGMDPSTISLDDPRLLKYILPTVGDGNKLIWYPITGAFRVGSSGNGKWEKELIGSFSFATGSATEASGSGSAALGGLTKAVGNYALSTGFLSEASGTSSASFGQETKALGVASFAFGQNTITKTRASFVAGLYNNISDFPDPANEVDSDRIFQIGNGDSDKRQNALTLLRNGFLGLGENALNPKYILDIEGRPRIRHTGVTAGIWFDGSDNVESGFVGMKTNEQIGFYHDTWTFWVNKQGNAFVKGNVSLTSDSRLKRNLSRLSGSLPKISDLQGYHYNWIDRARDQSIQTGLIAQEVEKLFPELVQTDDKGFKSVNYIGLIPHLIESVKELNKQNEILTSQNEKFQEQSATMMRKLEAMEARLDASESLKTEVRTK